MKSMADISLNIMNKTASRILHGRIELKTSIADAGKSMHSQTEQTIPTSDFEVRILVKNEGGIDAIWNESRSSHRVSHSELIEHPRMHGNRSTCEGVPSDYLHGSV